jgi:hypothetical protein
VITDFDPEKDVLDFSELYSEIELGSSMYDPPDPPENFGGYTDASSGTMIELTYLGETNKYVLVECYYFGSLNELMIDMPVADDALSPCHKGDISYYNSKCVV